MITQIKKTWILAFACICLVAAATTFSGCKKDDPLNTATGTKAKPSYRLTATNKLLLLTFTSQLSTNDCGMLVFNNVDALNWFQKEYLNTIPKWEYDSTASNGRFPFQNALEDALNFTSLRKRHENDENSYGPDFYLHDPVYIGSEDMSAALNEFHEMQVGGSYIKFLPNNYAAEIIGSNKKALSLVRARGLLARHPDLRFKNLNTGEYENNPIGPVNNSTDGPIIIAPDETDGTCMLTMGSGRVERLISNFNAVVHDYRNGTTATASFTWSVIRNSVPINTYVGQNVTITFPEVTSLTNDYDDFIVRVTAHTDASSTCGNANFTADYSVRIYKAGHDCDKQGHYRFAAKTFDHAGNTFMLSGEIGQEQWSAWLGGRHRMYATTRLYKRNDNGDFEPYSPHLFTYEETKVFVYFNYFLEGCTVYHDGGNPNSNAHAFPLAGEVREYNDMGSDRNYFGTVGNETDRAHAFKATFQARMQSNVIISMTVPISGPL